MLLPKKFHLFKLKIRVGKWGRSKTGNNQHSSYRLALKKNIWFYTNAKNVSPIRKNCSQTRHSLALTGIGTTLSYITNCTHNFTWYTAMKFFESYVFVSMKLLSPTTVLTSYHFVVTVKTTAYWYSIPSGRKA